jgi:hypothetical protein
VRSAALIQFDLPSIALAAAFGVGDERLLEVINEAEDHNARQCEL